MHSGAARARDLKNVCPAKLAERQARAGWLPLGATAGSGREGGGARSGGAPQTAARSAGPARTREESPQKTSQVASSKARRCVRETLRAAERNDDFTLPLYDLLQRAQNITRSGHHRNQGEKDPKLSQDRQPEVKRISKNAPRAACATPNAKSDRLMMIVRWPKLAAM